MFLYLYGEHIENWLKFLTFLLLANLQFVKQRKKLKIHMIWSIDINLYCSLFKYLLPKPRGSEIAFTSLCVHNLQREEWNSYSKI